MGLSGKAGTRQMGAPGKEKQNEQGPEGHLSAERDLFLWGRLLALLLPPRAMSPGGGRSVQSKR